MPRYLGLAAYLSGWLTLNLGWTLGRGRARGAGGHDADGRVFGLIALRATGLGFLMITLALGAGAVGPGLSLGRGDRRRQRPVAD